MKKVLFVAYYFPPFGGGGVQRTTKYAKYLRDFGWEPVVVTIDEKLIALQDSSLAEDIPPGLEEIRTKAWGLFVERLLKRKAIRVGPQAQAQAQAQAQHYGQISTQAQAQVQAQAQAQAQAQTQAQTQTQTQTQTRPVPAHRRLRKGLRQLAKRVFLFAYSLLLYPDDRIGWYPFALSRAKERLKKGDIDVIYTTSAPFTAHLVGLSLKRSTGLPWVADFRDPWAGNEYLNFRSLRRPLDRLLEGWCVRAADKVITVSEPLREGFIQGYPEEDPQKFQTILNGYDEADFEAARRNGIHRETEKIHRETEKCVFCYTGSFYQDISPRFFLTAVDELLTESKLPPSGILIKFLGQFGTESRELISEFQQAHPASIEVSGYLPHKEAVRAMLEADVLLLFLNASAGKGVFTQKIFEYLGAKRPVLAMIPEGNAAETIRRVKAGKVVAPDDLEGIKAVVREYCQAWQDGFLRCDSDDTLVARFSRKALAGQLAGIFAGVAQEVVEYGRIDNK